MFNISKLQNNPTDLILACAKEIIYEEGISAISMRKIAARCNIGVGTIYNYYPNKMDIIIGVVMDFWKDCILNFNINQIQNPDFFEEIELFYFHILKYLKQFRDDFLEYLSTLPYNIRIQAKEKESEFILILSSIFEEVFYKHEIEFNKTSFEYISKDDVIQYILDYFLVLLKRNEHDIKLYIYSLKKLLL